MKQAISKVSARAAAMAVLALILLCGMVSPAKADKLYEWNRSCRRKMSQTTTVYSSADPSRAVDTIPAGTYVDVGSRTDLRSYITYMKSDGVLRSGFVATNTVGSAVISFTDADGDRRGIQELQYYEMYGHNPPPGGVLDKPLPGGNGETVGKPLPDGNDETPDKPANSGSTANRKNDAKKAVVPAPNADVFYQGSKVSVKTWGFYHSVILVDGKEQTVPTFALTFSEKVEEDKRVAFIYAPRTGRCYLRAKASGKGDILDKCPAGTVVQVVKYGKSYCQIIFEGQAGYVQTACLIFADPEAEQPVAHQLSYNGKMTGAAQVPIRSDRSNDSASVMKLRSGTEVAVFAKSGKWYEVEYEGMHGYVHQNFLRMEE